ncbi:hypothetical protein ACT1UG_28465 [Bacillus paramycoides]|uniref:hypothetical protein n=1 Tax=Bacillus paramycoides TaxID=2026194 RepID=UPI00405985CD
MSVGVSLRFFAPEPVFEYVVMKNEPKGVPFETQNKTEEIKSQSIYYFFLNI